MGGVPEKKISGDGMETGYAVHEFGHGYAFYTAAGKQPLYELHRSPLL